MREEIKDNTELRRKGMERERRGKKIWKRRNARGNKEEVKERGGKEWRGEEI